MKKLHIPTIISKNTILLLFIFGFLHSATGQGWKFSFSASGPNNDVVHIPNFEGERTLPLAKYEIDQSDYFLFCNATGMGGAGFASVTNPSGGLSDKDYIPKSSIMLGTDTTIVLSTEFDPATNDYNMYLSRYGTDASGFPLSVIWNQAAAFDPDHVITAGALQRTLDGQLISLGMVASEIVSGGLANELVIVKSNLDGQIIWSSNLVSPGNETGVQIIPSADGGYWILKNVQADLTLPDVTMVLQKVDENGLSEWEVDLGINDEGHDMAATSDGSLVITGANADQDLFVLKTDALGFAIWRQDYPFPDRSMTGYGLIEDDQNNIVVAGKATFDVDGEEDSFIAKLSQNGTALWERTIAVDGQKDGFNDIVITPQGEYLMGGFLQTSPGSNGNLGRLVKSDTFGIVRGGVVHGNIFQDLNLDCLPSTDEINLADWKVQIVNDSLNYFGNTDENGNYSISLDAPSGSMIDYLVSVVPPNDYWIPCSNNIPITVSYLDSFHIDFPMQSLVSCPFMEAEISNSRYRPCEDANIYIDYCNNGTVVAEGAFIEVVLDDNLIYNSATIIPSAIDGQTYTFPFEDVEVNACEELVISVTVDCNSPDSIGLGDVLCIEANLYPDTICSIPNNPWAGGLLQLSYTCDNDSIFYRIENVGTSNTAQALEYIIIEDAVLLLEGDIDNLIPTGEEVPAGLPLDGTTYHLIAQQEPGAPGPEWISLGTMGCMNETSPPFVEFPQFAGGPFELIFCDEVVGSFDPNDKQANPSGFTEENFILPNTDINYTVRFQNTGTDTAFRVVILDTLSTVLDPATIVAGPSSHPYEFRLLDQGVLSFTFHDIALPDSTTNFEASQGFVSFRIAQDRDLNPGTLIENNAAIYFDFNQPIITNTVFHTITDFMEIVSVSINPTISELELKVIPNPMRDRAWIQLKGVQTEEVVTLRLFDVSGSLVQQAQGDSEGVWLERSDLVSGMYFFTMEAEGIWLASGKIVVE